MFRCEVMTVLAATAPKRITPPAATQGYYERSCIRTEAQKNSERSRWVVDIRASVAQIYIQCNILYRLLFISGDAFIRSAHVQPSLLITVDPANLPQSVMYNAILVQGKACSVRWIQPSRHDIRRPRRPGSATPPRANSGDPACGRWWMARLGSGCPPKMDTNMGKKGQLFSLAAFLFSHGTFRLYRPAAKVGKLHEYELSTVYTLYEYEM